MSASNRTIHSFRKQKYFFSFDFHLFNSLQENFTRFFSGNEIERARAEQSYFFMNTILSLNSDIIHIEFLCAGVSERLLKRA